MKLISTLLFLGNLNAGEVFLYDYTSPIEINQVIDNKLSVSTNVVGKTYYTHNNLSIVTSTNGNCAYILPHKIGISQRENTSVYFNGDILTYVNTFVLPSIVTVKESTFSISMNGETYVIGQNTNQNTIGTPMANISFSNASVFIKSGDKYTHVYVHDGTVTVHDSKSNKRKKDLKSGDYLVITPQVSLNPRDATVRSSGSSFSVKETDVDEINLHAEIFVKLLEKMNNTTFVNYDTNIFGIKLK